MRSRVGRGARAIVIAAVCCVALAACGGAQSRFASHMSRGQAYYKEGNYNKASIEFRNAVQIVPKDPDARIWAARVAERLGRPRDAYGLYQSVVDAYPDNLEARSNLGRLLIFGGAADRGLTVIQPALAKQPNNAELLTLRAAAKYRLKDSAAALTDVSRALSLAPLNEEALALRAGLYQQSGDFPQAEELIGNAVKKLPDSTNLRDILVRLYAASGDSAKEEEQLRDLIKLRPSEMKYRTVLANLYFQAKRPDDAQHVLESAVTAMPGTDSPKLLLVNFLATNRSPAEGERVLRGYIAAAPNDLELRLALGALLTRKDSLKEAVAAYQDVVSRDRTGPSGLMARDRLAAIALSQSRTDEARDLIAQVLATSPRDTMALMLRGDMAYARKDYKAAVADFRAVLRDQPRDMRIQRTLAAAYFADGETVLAEQSLQAAIEAAPKDVSVRVALADMLLQDRQVDQAIAMLEEGTRVAPQDPKMLEALVRTCLAKPDFAAAGAGAARLTALQPDSPVGPFLAGLAARGQKQLTEAQSDFEHAVALQPNAFEPLNALVQLQISRGQFPQAMALVQARVDHDPKSPLLLNLLGGLYLAQKNSSQAIQTLTTATTLAPNWPVSYRNLALAKYEAKDAAGGIAAYKAAIKAAPADPQYVNELVEHFLGEGHVDDAIATYEDWHLHQPQVQMVSANLAELLATYRTDRASLDHARDLTSAFATSNNGSLLDANGWVHFKRGEYADALSVLQRAALRTPDAPEVHYHLGMAEIEAGQSDRARTDLQAAVASSARAAWSDDARRVLSGLTAGTG
jgi:tetratricopeptide (TPR) repeat protein